MWNWLGISNENNSPEKSAEKDGEEIKTDDKTDTETPRNLKSEDNTKKMKDVAANIGSYIYNFANVAGQTASKLKETVDEKLEHTIVGDFQRENDKFVREKEARRIGDAVPPWEGYHEESVMKRQILALSADERNFLRDPPTGVDFYFDLSQTMPVAMAALKEDDDLNAMRFKLVPKKVKEEQFWRNYFYRVSLIKHSTQLSTMADLEFRRSPTTSSSESLNTKGVDKLDVSTAEQEGSVYPDVEPETAGSPSTNEFVSDTYQTQDEGLSEEEKNQMLGVSEKSDSTAKQCTGETKTLEDWEIEKELQDELESFELVDNETTPGGDDANWEQEIEDLLELEQDENKT